MLNFIESNAGRIATRIQSIGAGFDPEVLSLPGGSVIALLLWIYSGVAFSMHRTATHPAELNRAAPVAPAAACAGCLGRE